MLAKKPEKDLCPIGNLRPATVLSKEIARMSISNRSDEDSAVAPQQRICAALVTNSNRSDGNSAVAPQQRICAALVTNGALPGLCPISSQTCTICTI